MKAALNQGLGRAHVYLAVKNCSKTSQTLDKRAAPRDDGHEPKAAKGQHLLKVTHPEKSLGRGCGLVPGKVWDQREGEVAQGQREVAQGEREVAQREGEVAQGMGGMAQIVGGH